LDKSNEFIKFGFSEGMAIAIEEAYGYNYFPNPSVGASLITKDYSAQISTSHKGVGTDHAEIEMVKTIKSRNINTDNSILYVTLEPCMHEDTSPSCAKELAKSKLFNKIVIGDIDPDGRTNGKGIKYLESMGIEVEIEKGATSFLNPSYISSKLNNYDLHPDFPEQEWQQLLNTPSVKMYPIYIIGKIAVSKDMYIYSKDNPEKYITSEESLKLAHYLRGTVDAIIIGKNTLVTDEPSLDIRYGIEANQPERYVIWGSDRNSIDDYLIKFPDYIFFTSFDHINNNVYKIDTLEDVKLLDSFQMQDLMVKRGCRSLLVEGGNFAWLTFKQSMSKLYMFKSPKNLKSGLNISSEYEFDLFSGFISSKEIILSEDTLYIYNKNL